MPDMMGPVGIVAGGGSLPIEVAESLSRRGRAVHIVAIEGSAGCEVEAYPHTWTRIAAVGRLLGALRAACCREIIFVGRITRPEVRSLRPDLGFFRHLPMFFSILRDGDDAILTRILRFFERQGFTVLGVPAVAPELVARAGSIGRHEFRASDRADAALGARLIGAIGPLDVGQAVVVRGGKVIAIEAAEGTDRMLARAAILAAPDASPSGVLVKRPKPGQELRIDLPAIGPPTIAGAIAAQLSGIALAPGGALLLERERLIAAADDGRVAIAGLDEPAASPDRQVRELNVDEVAGRLRAARRRELQIAAEVSRRLAAFNAGAAVAVARRHVLAVSAAEGPLAMLARVRALRQWGDRSSARRDGVVVIRLDEPREPDIAALAAAIGSARLTAVAIDVAWSRSALEVLAGELGSGVTLVSLRASS
ncbi:MAG TPA: UDP-2,3-diacylglucosamine diphosphatase LpxI [Hyphomicrobiaceae bacterium]|nr:UDP-2,3-diacylglucosamine diphosphatase LpxI [Hyphomicrobiaceae bacterium]